MNKVLVIAVHPDDETLGCGGTLLKHKAQGDEIYWLVVTGPIKGDHPAFTDEFIAQRDVLVDKVSAEYGFKETVKLNLPTQKLHAVDLKDVILKMSDVLKRIQPDIIYMMYNNDVHSDHRVAFDAAYSCTKSFRYPFIKRILMIEALSETEFALATQGNSFVPNVFVDITPYIDKKLEIMSMFEGEIMEAPYPRSLSSIKALARVRGSRAGVMFAEAFQLLFERS